MNKKADFSFETILIILVILAAIFLLVFNSEIGNTLLGTANNIGP